MKVNSISVNQYKAITNKKQGGNQYTDIPKVSFKSDNRSSADYINGYFTIDTSPKVDLAKVPEKDTPVSDKITSEAQPYTSIFSKYPRYDSISAAPKITYDHKKVKQHQTSTRYGEREIRYYNGDKLVLEEYYAGPLYNGFSSCDLSIRAAAYYEPDGKTIKEKRSYYYEPWTGMEHGEETIEKYKDGEFDVKLQYHFGNGSRLHYLKDRFSEVRINEKRNEEWSMKYGLYGNKVLGVVYDLGSKRVLCEHKYEKDGSYCTVIYNPKNGRKVSEKFFDKYDNPLSGKDYDSETGEMTTEIKYVREGYRGYILKGMKYNNKQDLISETIFKDDKKDKELFYGDNQQVVRVIEYFGSNLKTETFYNDKQQITHKTTYSNDLIRKEEFYDDKQQRTKDIRYVWKEYDDFPREIELNLYKKGKLKKSIEFEDYSLYQSNYSIITGITNVSPNNKQVSEKIRSKYLSDIAECCKNPNAYVTAIWTYLDGKHIAHKKTYNPDMGGKKEENLISNITYALAAIPVLCKTKLPQKAKRIIKH